MGEIGLCLLSGICVWRETSPCIQTGSRPSELNAQGRSKFLSSYIWMHMREKDCKHNQTCVICSTNNDGYAEKIEKRERENSYIKIIQCVYMHGIAAKFSLFENV